jgi:predicted DNA-binding protein with PD1-like motif
MVSAESVRGRRIVGSLDRGADLFGELRSVCRRYGIRCGELRATGSLERAELTSFDQTRRRWKPGRALEGGLELLALSGNISEHEGSAALQARVTLMRELDSGVEVLGGYLIAAQVFSLEFVIECFDDVLLRRAADAATGLVPWREAITAQAAAAVAATTGGSGGDARDIAPAARAVVTPPTPATAAPSARRPSAPPPMTTADTTHAGAALAPPASSTAGPAVAAGTASWSAVVAASAARSAVAAEDADDEPHEPTIQVACGDVIVHPRFGRCVVVRVEGEQEYIHVRLRNDRVVRLSLDVLSLRAHGNENGQRIFRAEID